MSSGEKKIAVVLVVVLIAVIGAYFALGSRIETAQVAAPPRMAGAGGRGGEGGAGGGGYAETSSLGSEGAKVKITALVPIANPCHAATVSALKDAYAAHPNDIHLTLIDFQGPDAGEWKQKLGVTCATVDINGQYTFDLEGRTVTFQKQEGGTYKPADLRTVVEAELERAG
jgi:ABC-type glycerol-3-phosphate transport system substrate-binding protein